MIRPETNHIYFSRLFAPIPTVSGSGQRSNQSLAHRHHGELSGAHISPCGPKKKDSNPQTGSKQIRGSFHGGGCKSRESCQAIDVDILSICIQIFPRRPPQFDPASCKKLIGARTERLMVYLCRLSKASSFQPALPENDVIKTCSRQSIIIGDSIAEASPISSQLQLPDDLAEQTPARRPW